MSYTLTHGPALRAGAPYTFFLPHPWLVSAVRVGDLVQLGFNYEPPGEKYSGERIWVEIDKIDSDGYSGHLVNEPDEPQTILKHGDVVSFARENILSVLLVDKSRLPDIEDDLSRYPHVPDERQFWERCLVDECVLYHGVPVEYLYREEPGMADPEDKYPDSGWRIRGRKGDTTDQEMDDRKLAYVALGAVLNQDNSWVQLIDEPVGSAFLRNFDTGTYDAVN